MTPPTPTATIPAPTTGTVAPPMTERPRLIVVSPGDRHHHERSLATLAQDFEVVVVDKRYPTWQGRYAETHRVARTTDAARLFSSVADLRGEVPDAGVLTWDGASVVAVAEVAAKIGMRSLSPDAARTCADRAALDEALAAAGLRTPRRPTAEQDGLVLTAHCVVLDGAVRVVAVSRTLPPGKDAESATGVVVGPWRGEPWSDDLQLAAVAAHRAVGADWGVTQFDVRTVDDGLEVAGLRPWPAGDLVPALVAAATGIDLIAVAAAVAFESDPDVVSRSDRYATLRFLSSTRSGTVRALTLPDLPPGSSVFAAQALVAVDDEVGLDGGTTRCAALLAVGDDEAVVRASLDDAEAATLIDID